MRDHGPVQWIAARTLFLAETGGDVVIEIGMPTLRPPDTEMESESWFCAVRITGLGSGRTHFVYGVDGFQALSLALKHIGSTLTSEDAYKDGGLQWLCNTDLDFPTLESW